MRNNKMGATHPGIRMLKTTVDFWLSVSPRHIQTRFAIRVRRAGTQRFGVHGSTNLLRLKTLLSTLFAELQYQQTSIPANQGWFVITRFLLLSAVVHGLALTWIMDQPSSATLQLAAPTLSVTVYAQEMPALKMTAPQHEPTDHKYDTADTSSQLIRTARPEQESRQGNIQSDDKRQAQHHNQLIALVKLALDRHFTYPPLARKYGWQGEVHLNARLGADGQLHNVRVSRSSGYAILDDDAVYTLQQIGTVPHVSQLSQWLGKQGYDFELPVIYRLTQGS